MKVPAKPANHIQFSGLERKRSKRWGTHLPWIHRFEHMQAKGILYLSRWDFQPRGRFISVAELMRLKRERFGESTGTRRKAAALTHEFEASEPGDTNSGMYACVRICFRIRQPATLGSRSTWICYSTSNVLCYMFLNTKIAWVVSLPSFETRA